MKEYRTNKKLINYLSSRGVIIANKEILGFLAICEIKKLNF